MKPNEYSKSRFLRTLHIWIAFAQFVITIIQTRLPLGYESVCMSSKATSEFLRGIGEFLRGIGEWLNVQLWNIMCTFVLEIPSATFGYKRGVVGQI